jgi:hypothetical protein
MVDEVESINDNSFCEIYLLPVCIYTPVLTPMSVIYLGSDCFESDFAEIEALRSAIQMSAQRKLIELSRCAAKSVGVRNDSWLFGSGARLTVASSERFDEPGEPIYVELFAFCLFNGANYHLVNIQLSYLRFLPILERGNCPLCTLTTAKLANAT